MDPTYELISEQILTSNQSSVLFSNIPQGYRDLNLVCSVRGNNTGAIFDGVYLRFNTSSISFNDSELSQRHLQGSGSAASSVSVSGVIAAILNGPNSTSNTYGVANFYIPNAFSNSNKSISFYSFMENNITESYIREAAALWSNTSPISSILCFPANTSGNVFLSGSIFQLYGIKNADDGGRGFFGPAMTGGNEVFTTGDGYKYHVFKSSGFLNVSSAGEAEVFMVAGGGGGGALGGGGGGGGVIIPSSRLINPGQYSVLVGAGGSSAAANSTSSGGNGSDSSFYGIVAVGGGGGGTYFGTGRGNNGGSGGGAGTSGVTASSGISTQGNSGGIGWITTNPPGDAIHGGGGGGYSSVGSNATLNFGGNGGQGYSLPSQYSSFLSQSVVSSGGGGGARFTCFGTINGTPGTGGTGAGNGSTNGATAGSATTYGSGGGGSGQTQPSGTWGASGSGQQGIVIIRYRI